MTVKLNVHDWPKRGQFMRTEVNVEAKDDIEAIALGIIEGQQKYPHGKVKAYDVKRALVTSTALNSSMAKTEPVRGKLSLKAS